MRPVIGESSLGRVSFHSSRCFRERSNSQPQPKSFVRFWCALIMIGKLVVFMFLNGGRISTEQQCGPIQRQHDFPHRLCEGEPFFENARSSLHDSSDLRSRRPATGTPKWESQKSAGGGAGKNGGAGRSAGLSGTESRIARFPESRAWNRQKVCSEKPKNESNRSKVESQKIDSESPSESHPISMLKATLESHDSESLNSRFRIADAVPLRWWQRCCQAGPLAKQR